MVMGSTAEIKFSQKQDVTGHKEGAKNMAPLLFWGQGRNMLITNLHKIWGCSNPPPKAILTSGLILEHPGRGNPKITSSYTK